MNFKVAETFISINGEGKLAGELSVFVRFAGCNLSCAYCDTSWANSESVNYTTMSESEIFEYIKNTKIKNVTITGGEPLIQERIMCLLNLLATDDSLSVEIQTNGSVDIRPFLNIFPNPPAFTLDYKTKSSEMNHLMALDNYNYLKPSDTVKFVVGDVDDLLQAKSIIENYDLTNKCNVHLSSIFGKIGWAQIVDFMKENNMRGVRLQPQLHKIIWDPNLRGV